MSSGNLEFLKNGRSLGVAFTSVHGFVFPVVGIGSYGAHIRVDFRPHTESWSGQSEV